jgi:hypothetical protein
MNLPCRKYPYPSRSAARAAIRRIRADGDSSSSLNVYRCPVLGCERAWHVGHRTHAGKRLP